MRLPSNLYWTYSIIDCVFLFRWLQDTILMLWQAHSGCMSIICAHVLTSLSFQSLCPSNNVRENMRRRQIHFKGTVALKDWFGLIQRVLYRKKDFKKCHVSSLFTEVSAVLYISASSPCTHRFLPRILTSETILCTAPLT